MRLTIIFILLLTSPTLAFAAQCTLTENQLIGVWVLKNNIGAFEETEFALEGNRKVFNSWRDHRPDISNGTWVLKNCKLNVAHRTERALSFNFDARLRSRDDLELKEEGEPVAKYHRFKSKKAP